MIEKSKYKILIDTSERKFKNIQIIRIDDNFVLATETGSQDLVEMLGGMLKKHNITLNEIEVFEPNLGPGSFTGLKIGVTTANVLNWALNKKTTKEMFLPNYGQEPNIHPTKWLE